MKNISISFIKELNQEYKKDKNNKIIENSIKNTGIDMFCLNSDIVNKTGKIFSIELPKSKIYNQEDSGLCWIYAGINLIKNNVANNLNIDENNFTLSINYLSFLDKL